MRRAGGRDLQYFAGGVVRRAVNEAGITGWLRNDPWVIWRLTQVGRCCEGHRESVNRVWCNE